jgi:hypothetical protein
MMGVAGERRYDLRLRAAAIGLLTRRKDAEGCRGKYRREAWMNKDAEMLAGVQRVGAIL